MEFTKFQLSFMLDQTISRLDAAKFEISGIQDYRSQQQVQPCLDFSIALEELVNEVNELENLFASLKQQARNIGLDWHHPMEWQGRLEKDGLDNLPSKCHLCYEYINQCACKVPPCMGCGGYCGLDGRCQE